MTRLDRIGSVLVAKSLIDTGVVRPDVAIPILMYHSVSDDPESGVKPYYRLATSPARFAEQMHWIADLGYTVVDLRMALEGLGVGPTSPKSLVITFDDGFRDFHTHAWPTMARLGFTATMFLPTSFIGDDRRSFKGRECLTWEEVRELQSAGMTFGSHTVSHPKLYGAEWASIRQELAQSRETLEQQLQQPVATFAYPYAFPQEDRAFADRFRNELGQQGYTGCVTTVIGRATSGSDPLCLERLPINQADDRSLFAAKLAGAYDWMGRVQLMTRRTKRSVKAMLGR